MRNKIAISEACGKVKAVYENEGRKVERTFTVKEAEALMVALEAYFFKRELSTILEAAKVRQIEKEIAASGTF